MKDIAKINQSESIHPDKPNINSYEKKKHKRKKHGQEAKKHYDELIKIVDETHKDLEEKNSPFRLCVYQEGDDIFIDVVAIDNLGKITQVFKHDISHAQFEHLIHQLKSGRGLILDTDA
ncbi:hypothetical protein [Desulfobacula phenolica]|uniref:Uncharacterized protein n=1 Tax=Desulfobacula phenolica TaxID=90732 RepID=A0A1H2DTE2_9BACT|nr:hypothetical protein [Desulfobacula phenolica]SDT86074.1 hypothetical protein SAMN04487931_102149 [Desulfobacula phenolica]